MGTGWWLFGTLVGFSRDEGRDAKADVRCVTGGPRAKG